jgi:hypothetical protein
MACCNDDHCAASDRALNSQQWRRALWIALTVNGGFFLAEIIAGLAAGSSALQADAHDFFGDAASYTISLGVAGMALGVRTRAALLKGGTLIVFALWVLGSTAWHAGSTWRVRHRHWLAGHHRCCRHGRPRPLGQRADRPPGYGRARHAVGPATCRIGFAAAMVGDRVSVVSASRQEISPAIRQQCAP